MAHKEDSLWTILHERIKSKGILTYGEMCQICAEEEYKVDTARRRIDDMSDVKPLKKTGKRGGEYIYAYEWIGEQVKAPATIKEFYNEKYKEALNPPLFIYKVDPKHAISELRDPN